MFFSDGWEKTTNQNEIPCVYTVCLGIRRVPPNPRKGCIPSMGKDQRFWHTQKSNDTPMYTCITYLPDLPNILEFSAFSEIFFVFWNETDYMFFGFSSVFVLVFRVIIYIYVILDGFFCSGKHVPPPTGQSDDPNSELTPRPRRIQVS